jgi:4-hydroxybenzoate polyprenyltransferase
MRAPEAYAPVPLAEAGVEPVETAPTGAVAALAWAGLASTLHRVRRGEGALLAVNLSLVGCLGASPGRALAQAAISMIVIALMYAFNDLYDAPTDWNNPKKDRGVIAAYIEHRQVGVVALVVLKLLTVAIAFLALGPGSAAVVTGVMLVNVVYSMVLKGVPVADVAWVWLWGALYAGIAGAPASLIAVVGLMTSVCHLFQTLDDRRADAEVGIRTTAVRSPVLARNVLCVLSLLLFVALAPALGVASALTAFVPLGLFFLASRPGVAWLLTKAYFAVVWLALLGMVPGAAA